MFEKALNLESIGKHFVGQKFVEEQLCQILSITIIFSRILDWFPHFHDKQWIQLQIGSSPLNPKAALWLPIKDTGSRSSWPWLTYTVLECWHHYLKSFPLSSIPGPLTPLIDNPSFPIGVHSHSILSWDKSYWPQIRHMILEGTFMSFLNFQTLHDQKKGLCFFFLSATTEFLLFFDSKICHPSTALRL